MDGFVALVDSDTDLAGHEVQYSQHVARLFRGPDCDESELTFERIVTEFERAQIMLAHFFNLVIVDLDLVGVLVVHEKVGELPSDPLQGSWLLDPLESVALLLFQVQILLELVIVFLILLLLHFLIMLVHLVVLVTLMFDDFSPEQIFIIIMLSVQILNSHRNSRLMSLLLLISLLNRHIRQPSLLLIYITIFLIIYPQRLVIVQSLDHSIVLVHVLH